MSFIDAPTLHAWPNHQLLTPLQSRLSEFFLPGVSEKSISH